MDTNKAKAHREPMVWLVFGLPAVVVVASVVTLAIAIKSHDGGEVTDEVQRTAQIQQSDLGPDARAGEMGLRVLLREREGRIEVLPMAGNFPVQQALHLVAEHPTDRTQDRVLVLAPQPGQAGWMSMAAFETTRKHAWKFTLTPGNEQWRLRGRMPKAQSTAVLLPSLGQG